MNSWNTPLYNAIKAYADSKPLPFHMPGHKLGTGIPGLFLTDIAKLDITEIPGLDNLHEPAGVLKEAQELAARAFGAKKSYFLVNGSTVGLHAAIAAVCRPGGRLIAGRDSHKAVINGMLMAGVVPYYMLPEYSEKFGIFTGITPGTVDKALCEAPDADGVLITRPNYYGVCSDVKEIANVVHSYGKVLIVDEAHGPHLAFNSRLPCSALEAGADLCIQSAHKTLPAFTQGAYLHIGTDRVDPDRLSYYLDIFQTTSPSYVIMAYLDIAREIMQKCGSEMLDRLLDSIETFAGDFGDGNVRILDRRDLPGFELDRTRITANVSQTGMTGYAAEKMLRDKYNIQVEMSDADNVVCIATVADNRDGIRRLFEALAGLDGVGGAHGTMPHPRFHGFTLPDQAMEPSAILNAQAARVPLKDAPGRISKGVVSPYPPGYAMVCPGERFTREAVEYIIKIIEAGGVVNGVDSDNTVAVIRQEIKQW